VYDRTLPVIRGILDIAMSVSKPFKRGYRSHDGLDQYETPDEVFNHYDAKYHFYMDVCATRESAKVRRFFTKETDALTKKWIGPCWMNPPYSGLKKWVKYAHEQSLQGATVVGLVPAWCGDSWFHEFVGPFAQVTFLRKRLKFMGSNRQPFAAYFANMVCVWPREAAIHEDGQKLTITISARF